MDIKNPVNYWDLEIIHIHAFMHTILAKSGRHTVQYAHQRLHTAGLCNTFSGVSNASANSLRAPLKCNSNETAFSEQLSEVLIQTHKTHKPGILIL